MTLSSQKASYQQTTAVSKKKALLLILSTGFAMFSMFFGSGNLVFPLLIGKITGGEFTLSTIGLILTGVLVPFAGLIGIMVFGGSYEKFFARLGEKFDFLLPLLMLSLLGPFGVVPRCLTVAYGSFTLLVPDMSLELFSAGMCGVVFLLSFDKRKIVPFLGVVLTPFLLAALSVIIVKGFQGSIYPSVSAVSSGEAFARGFIDGYQMMDLLAAFFFAAVVIRHINDRVMNENIPQKQSRRIITWSLLIGAGLLAIVYSAFVYLGAAHANVLEQGTSEQFLGLIARLTMGPLAAPVLCVAVILACLTTAVVLSALFSEFLQQRVLSEKINLKFALALTLITSWVVSTYEFSGIAVFLGPILTALYPGLIVLTALNIAHKLWDVDMVKAPVFLTFFTTAVGMIFI